MAAIARSCERSAQRSRSARRHLELVADLGRLVEHLLAGERVGQPVVDHRVERLRVAHAEAEARLGQQVRAPATSTPCRRRRRPRRRPRGSPGRASPTARTPEAQTLLIVSEETSFGIPAVDLRLARRDLALAGLQHLAHDDVLDLARARRSARSSAALIAMPPSSVAWSEDRPPPSLPTGVRAVPRITVLGMGVSGRMQRTRERMAAHPARRPPPTLPLDTGADTVASASSTARASPTTSRAARSARCSTPARPSPASATLALAHAEGKRWLLVGLGERDAFDAERARVAAAVALGPRAGARDARRCAGSCRTRSPTTLPARSSRARCWPPTGTRASSPSRGEDARASRR